VIIDIAEERMIVISDLHLGNPASQAANSLRGFLDYIREGDFSLCINGDGFEMLQTRAGPLMRDALPLMSQISRLVREGRRVYYVVGNHDIYAEHFLDQWFVTGFSPFLNVTSGAKRIRVEHGHLYDPVFVRWPGLYESLTRLSGRLLFLHPDVYKLWDEAARRLDGFLRHSADAGGEPVNYHRAADEVMRRGFDAVIFGHTHRAESSDLANGLYINSGHWLRGGTYVEIDRGNLALKTWPDG